MENRVPRRILYAAYFARSNDYPAFHVPVMIFYGTQYLHLSVTTTILLFYGLASISNFFEIPAGVFADRYGRRLSYVIGAILLTCGYTVWLFQAPIIVLAIARIVASIGDSMTSGTIDAMVYEEHERRGAGSQYVRYRSRSSAGFYVMRIVGMPLGSWLFSIKPQYAMIATVVAIVTSGVVSFLVPDNNVVSENHTSKSLLKETVSGVFTNRPVRLLVVSIFTMGILTELFWRAFQPAYADSGLNIAYIGWFYAAFSFMGFLTTLYSTKVKYKRQVYGIIVVTIVCMTALYGIMSIFPFIIVIVAVQVFNSILFAFTDVSVPTIIQNQFEKHQQSTVLSIFSMTVMGGLAVGGILEGILLDFMEVKTTYFVMFGGTCVLFVALVPTLLKYMRSQDPTEELHEKAVPPPIVPPPTLR